jgi:hypothetical protein
MRFRFVRFLAPLARVGVLGAATVTSSTPAPEVTVYKSPSCGCCTSWVDHLKANGFTVVVHDQDDLSDTKTMLGVPRAMTSCHTAVVAGYVIEGHVPAADLARFLKQKPKVLGLAVPGMPAGSPGMEGGKPVPYKVLTFDKDGRTTVFASH